MSYLTHAILIFHQWGDKDQEYAKQNLETINRKIAESSNGQRFELLDMDKSGGRKFWCYETASACFNYFTSSEIEEALTGIGESLVRCGDVTLMVENEDTAWQIIKLASSE
jgi:hypothetical protein